jgi:hypothetical protein
MSNFLEKKKKFKATHAGFMSTAKWLKLFAALQELKEEFNELNTH